MSSSGEARSPVELLADEFLARCKRGEKPTIKEYCSRRPDLADEIRDVFEALLMVEDLKPGSDEAGGSHVNSARTGGKRLEQVGDYRILCELGRGGMGVVYEAEQQALGRRVALKVLPKTAAGAGSALIRFQREAKAAARMHHTNIVPVFDVGQDGDHVYYAMQLIHGQGLDLVIHDLQRLRAQSVVGQDSHRAPETEHDRGLAPQQSIAASLVTGKFAQENLAADPGDANATANYEGSAPSSAVLPGQSELSTVSSNRQAFYGSIAQIGVQTASALSYAHARGIIHRDIKPGNLLLDTTGNVWVTDFGLAKTGDGGMTHSGDILGTIRYMSPERFRGQCDVRADLYALGMTLYEMLTLKAAYVSEDRLKLIELIRQTEPASPRSIDSRIPRDLETIVMKAIDKDPKRRYQSADDMGDDLQRFVNDEPIKARRIGTAERLTRWCRRNPAVAGLIAAVLLLMAAGTAVSAWQAVVANRARADLAAKNAALAEEQAKVEARFELARKAIALFHTGVSEEALLKNAEFSELRTKLLQEAAGFYAELEQLLAGQTDVKSRQALAAAYFQLGELTKKIDDEKEALAVHRKALALRRELAEAEGADVETRLDLARSLEAVGRRLRSTGHAAEALSAFQEERDLAAALEAESPTDAVRAQLAFGHNLIGFLQEDSGKSAAALESYRKALAIYQTLPEAGQYLQPDFGPTLGLQLQAGTYMSIGFLLHKTGKAVEGLESLRKASDIMQRLANANPANTSVQEYLANSYNLIGVVLAQMKKPAEALEASSRALAIFQKLADNNPAVTHFQAQSAGTKVNMAIGYRAAGRLTDAIKLLEEALPVMKARMPDHEYTLNCRKALADFYDAASRTQEALEVHKEILQFQSARLGPDHPETVRSLVNLAHRYCQLGRPEEAIRLYREPLSILKAKMPDHAITFTCISGLGVAYDAAGRTQEALALREEALQLFKVKCGPDHPSTLGSIVNLAISYQAVGRLTDAIKLLEEALPVMKAKLPDHHFTFNCMNCLANVYAAAGSTQEALKLREEVLQLRKANLGPDHPDTLRNITDLAIAYAAAGRAEEALKLREETLPLTKAKLGADHPDTLGSMVNLANSYLDAGRFADAIKLLEEALPVMKAKLPDHQFTFNCMHSLAKAYAPAGRAQEALKLCEEALQLRKAKFGPDHPNTMAELDRTSLIYLTVAAQQAWFGQEQEWAAVCERALSMARDTKITTVADRVAKLCSLRPSNDKRIQAALDLARRAVELGQGHQYLPYFQMALGMAEYRSGHSAETEAALAAAMEAGKNNLYITGTSAFYRAMNLFRVGKQDEARQLATQAAANMKPLPKDDKKPLADGANPGDLILWMAYKEAKDLIKFDGK